MPNYKYRVVDKTGTEKKGNIAAPDLASATQSLRGEGNLVLSVEEPSVLDKDITLPFRARVKIRDMAVFCRQFVTLVNASVSIVRSLEMLEDQTQSKLLKQAIHETRVSVEKGNSLADSMRLNEDLFTPMFVNLVAAGEQAGKMDTAFTHMADHFEKTAKLQATVKKALIYPVILSIVALIVIIVMLTYIVPMYTSMFEQMDTALPPVTMFVVGLSNAFINYWFVIVAVIIAIILAARTFGRTDKGKHFFDMAKLRVPIMGTLNQKRACAELSRNLATLIGSGISIMHSLEITGQTMTNIIYSDLMETCKDQVGRGIQLHVPLQQSEVIPPMIYHMVGIGEETGAMDSMLEKAADYYEEEVQQATEQAAAALEPMVIIFMALVVIGIIAAVYAPMLTMYSSIGSL